MSSTRTGIRIGMWSGPRNISTALMRSWDSRSDTFVCDEPLYAHYLQQTGLPHPGRDEVLRHQDPDWTRVVEWLAGPVPDGRRIFYQKHMAHHLLPGMSGPWLLDLRNVLLIREPSEMLTSLIRVTPDVTAADTGLPQQWELFGYIRETSGHPPPVIDARDVLEDPPGVLRMLCDVLEVPYSDSMLRWEAGPRKTDGVWAKHWYAAVERSTGFAPYRPKGEPVPGALAAVHEECLTFYRRLHGRRLRPRGGPS